MNGKALRAQWKMEESYAFEGWDFSHLDGRWRSEEPPWDYRQVVLSQLRAHDRLLDMGTGGGEFLMALQHDPHMTCATEGYAPNLSLCRARLSPLGIDVRPAADDGLLPFEDGVFDLVINRHSPFDPAEVARVLRPGGRFITQQVGGYNDRELSVALIENFHPPYPDHTLAHNQTLLRDARLSVERGEECFTPLRFYDVGALVYFARIIEWEFPGFSVDRCLERLLDLELQIVQHGFIEATEHRFLIVCQKPM